MVLVGAAISAAWLVVLVPWRVPSRPLADVAPPRSATVRVAAGGPLWGATAALAATFVHPVVAVPVLAWPTWRRWTSTRRDRADHRHQALRSLPEAADLIGLGVGAGLPVRDAVRHAAAWVGEPYRAVFVEALRRADAGEAFARALDAASATLDPVARPLLGLLVAADADGRALLNGLVRVGDEARHRRRAAAEARARRLPVTMLLPLVLCVLPAFGLLAVAPLVLGALGDLDLGF